MSFIEIIPGLSIPAATGSRNVSRKGSTNRSARGKAQDGGRGHRPAFSFRTSLSSYDEANSIAQILRGRGDVIYFRNGTQGSKGTMPKEMGTNCAFDLNQASPFDDDQGGGLYGEDPSAYLIYDYQLGQDWDLNSDYTILWCEFNGGDSAWHRSALRSDGTFVFDGLFNNDRWDEGSGNGMEWMLRVDDGQLRMEAIGGDGGTLYHVVVLPFIASDTVIDAFMNSTVAWGPLPALRVTGDVITTDHEFMFGSVKSESWKRADLLDGEGLRSNNLIIDFELEFIPSNWFQDSTVPSQGTTKCAPEAPIVLQTGNKTILYNSDGTSTSHIWAGLSARDEATPTVSVTVTRPGAAFDYANLITYEPDGEIGFIRTVSGDNEVFGASCDVSPVDGSIAICGWGARLTTTIDVKDETGVTLGTISKPAGSSNEWAWWALFSSTGALIAVHGNTWSVAPTDITYARCAAFAVRYSSSGRLYMAGAMGKVDSAPFGTPNPLNFGVPVIGGVSYPASNANINTMQGTWVCEISPATGLGIALTANDNPDSTTNNRSFVFFPLNGLILGMFLTMDPDGEHMVLTSNYNGYNLGGVGFLRIGRGGAGEFNTRVFTSWPAGEVPKPYAVRYTADLLPVAAATVRIDPVGTNAVAVSIPGEPALSTTKMFWSWQAPAGTSGTGASQQRNPTPYATDVPVVHKGSGFGNFQSLPSDFGDPRTGGGFTVGFWDTASGQGTPTKALHSTMSHDGSKVLVNAVAQGSNFDTAVSFLGGANVAWDLRQSWLVAVDAVTGAEVWKAKLSRFSTANIAKSLKTHQYATGPEAGKIYAACAFTSSHLSDHGANDSVTDALAYNCKTLWPSLVGGQSKMSLHMVARDDDGKVIPASSFPMMLGTVSEITAGVVVDFRIS